MDIHEGSVVYRTMKINLTERGRKKLEEGEIEGHASVFGVQDSFGTIMDKGAFRKTIRDKFGDGRIRFLFNHNVNEVMGVLTDLREDSKGLFFRARFSEILSASEKLQLVRDGALGEMSIGFMVDKIEIDETKNEIHFKRVELFDVSLVTFASNPKATVSEVRNYNPAEIEAVKSLAQNDGVELSAPGPSLSIPSIWSPDIDPVPTTTVTTVDNNDLGSIGITVERGQTITVDYGRIDSQDDDVDDDDDGDEPEDRSDINLRIHLTVDEKDPAEESATPNSDDDKTDEVDSKENNMDAVVIRSALALARASLDRSIAQDLLEEEEIRGELEELLEVLSDTIGDVEDLRARKAAEAEETRCACGLEGCECEDGACKCEKPSEDRADDNDKKEQLSDGEEEAEDGKEEESGAPALDRSRRLRVAQAV